jgi:hypothetical protein
MLVSVFKDGVIQLNMAEQCEVLDSFFCQSLCSCGFLPAVFPLKSLFVLLKPPFLLVKSRFQVVAGPNGGGPVPGACRAGVGGDTGQKQ